jgi:hypothetical protein
MVNEFIISPWILEEEKAKSAAERTDCDSEANGDTAQHRPTVAWTAKRTPTQERKYGKVQIQAGIRRHLSKSSTYRNAHLIRDP